MKKEYELLLSVLKSTAADSGLRWTEPLSENEFAALYRLSFEHNVLPLVVEKLCKWPLFEHEKHTYMVPAAKRFVIRQARRTAEFRLFYLSLEKQGLQPTLMKGMALRSLYPIPEQRESMDEDLLISPEDMSRYHEAALAYGLTPVSPAADIEKDFEVAYEDKSRYLYIEFHKTPFSPESSYGYLNNYFTDACKNAVSTEIDGLTFRTLAPTDHLLFLILHIYKHFLHGGIGIRQIFDLNLFTRAHTGSIRWEHIIDVCQEAHISKFARTLYAIGEKHLGIDNKLPEAWQTIETDEFPLLDDILSGGLYGMNDENRAHSSTITVNAAAVRSSGKASRIKGILKAAFPDYKTMAGRYLYVNKHPILLPSAWCARIWTYLRKTRKDKTVKSKESIRIANERIKLMKKYEMIS